jgi:hypothetical protein
VTPLMCSSFSSIRSRLVKRLRAVDDAVLDAPLDPKFKCCRDRWIYRIYACQLFNVLWTIKDWHAHQTHSLTSEQHLATDSVIGFFKNRFCTVFVWSTRSESSSARSCQADVFCDVHKRSMNESCLSDIKDLQYFYLYTGFQAPQSLFPHANSFSYYLN